MKIKIGCISGAVSVLVLFYQMGSAQIIEEVRPMSKGNYHALAINLPGASEEVVENVWKTYVKAHGAKVRYERKDQEFQTIEVKLPAMAASPGGTVNLYSVLEVSEDNVLFVLWIERGEDLFVTSKEPIVYEEAEKFLLQFALEVAQSEVRLDLENQETELRRLESTLKKLQNDKEHYEREIENARERIARAEKDIKENAKEQGAVRQMIEQQLQRIDQVRSRLKALNR